MLIGHADWLFQADRDAGTLAGRAAGGGADSLTLDACASAEDGAYAGLPPARPAVC